MNYRKKRNTFSILSRSLILLASPVYGGKHHPKALTFTFTSERGDFITRSLHEYQINTPELYAQVRQKNVLVFGGMHLTAEQAFKLSKKYAQKGRLDLMINVGVPNHEGHTVINTDPNTCPDYQEDFMSEGLINRLSLSNKFEFAIFENVRPALSIDQQSLTNAWEALQTNGSLIIYPAEIFHFPALAKVGFQQIKLHSSYHDIFSDRHLQFPACTAKKPGSPHSIDPLPLLSFLSGEKTDTE